MFSNLTEQITILRNKGVIINDERFAKHALINNNYYNIVNAFKSLFLESSNPERYKQGTKFEELYSTFIFDKKLRALLLEYILLVENRTKTFISYEFSKAHDEYGYLDKNNFNLSDANKKKSSLETINDIFGKITKSSNSDIVKHFIYDKNEHIPIWALFNILTFGDVRKFYDNMQISDKMNVAGRFHLNHVQLLAMLSAINMFRNICAHDNRVLMAKIKDKNKKIPDMPIHEELLIPKQNDLYIYGKNDFFSIVICFKYLLQHDEFLEFYNSLKHLSNELEASLTTISINDITKTMGFPDNWGEIINFD